MPLKDHDITTSEFIKTNNGYQSVVLKSLI